MSKVAYFIGGPQDLTKRALSDKEAGQDHMYFARLGKVGYKQTGPGSIVPKNLTNKVDRYRLVASRFFERPQHVYIYEYMDDGDDYDE